MSVNLLSERHLSAIIGAGIHLAARQPLMWATASGAFTLTPQTATAAVHMLESANRAALVERYADEPETEPSYTYTGSSKIVDPVAVIKLIHSYQYQCSDWSQWPDSEARTACEAITRLCCTCLAGYGHAPWVV